MMEWTVQADERLLFAYLDLVILLRLRRALEIMCMTSRSSNGVVNECRAGGKVEEARARN